MGDNVYYVYEWYNVENGEIFYVGKGKNYRYKNVSHRNKFFKDYYNSHNCDVRKIYENLSEEEAFYKEMETIKKYKSETTNRLTNQTNGGEGNSGLIITEEFRNKMREITKGERNPNYNNKWSEKQKENARKRMLGRYNGENNPNYNNRWSEEQIKEKHNKAKRVICDNILYVSLSSCAKYYNIPYPTMQCWINNINPMPQNFKNMGLRWATKEEIEEYEK